jgi:hypothetical protein
MRKFYILLISFVASYTNAQLTISPGTLTASTNEADKYTYYMTVTNTTNSTVNMWWKLIRNSDFPSGWSNTICDLNLCYAPDFLTCPKTKPNVFGPNETKICTLYFEPNGVVGVSGFHFEMYSDKDFTNLIAETDPTAVVQAGTSSTNNIISDLKIYPNPTDDYFVVRNDANVAKVGLFNIVGKEIFTYRHNIGTSYDVSNMNKGVYIVKLFDNRGKTIKSIRLSKK